MAKLADVEDAVKALNWTLQRVNAAEGRTVPQPRWAARPETALARHRKLAIHQRRMRNHQMIASRLLGNRKPVDWAAANAEADALEDQRAAEAD